MKKKRMPGGKLAAPVLRMLMIGLITYLIVVVLLLVGMAPEQYDIKVGFPASIDILATKDVVDTVTTEALRKRAADQVEESYKGVDDSVLGTVTADLNDAFARLLALRDGAQPDESINEGALEAINRTLPVALTLEQYTALTTADRDTLDALFGDAASAVRDALISTLPEGQEDASVSRIARVLASSGYPTELVALSADVMRACIRPNMLIDVEITEANRQKAMDAVEPKTFLRGEAIVRRGERVTEAQYQMLSTLGLLKEDTLDLHMMGGVALLVLLVLAALALYLYCFERQHLNPKTVLLIAVIFLLVLVLSLTLGFWNTYLIPVSLGMMLLSVLVGRRVALFTNLALGVIISLLNTVSSGHFTMPMFSFIVMCLVSAPIIMWVYARRTQRTTTLLAGVLVGVSNFLVTLAVGLINSSEMRAVLTNALYAMGSGLLSAVLCIGIQPVLELIFNLATNSRLIELSNPNQPLLRRLLLEAPGTYHHAIIVANLAEAAANAIGANGLLARVGAYYHDVGKLKRPGYFTENQVGDNPHDRTDPRVSAAILTAHPRDGYQLAQKARIPQPVLDIIRQHHGDGVTLYFYDKAVKLYGAEHVDINAFRYEGPRPRTKEAAAVMLADTIEAATRSIPNPTPEKIDAMLRKLVRGKLADGQLDESDLTFKDLEMVCSAFSTVLTGVFHERIEYPDIAVPPRTDHAPEARPAEPPKPAAVPAQEPSKPAVASAPETPKPAAPAPEAAKTAAEVPKPAARPAQETAPHPAVKPQPAPAGQPAPSCPKPTVRAAAEAQCEPAKLQPAPEPKACHAAKAQPEAPAKRPQENAIKPCEHPKAAEPIPPAGSARAPEVPQAASAKPGEPAQPAAPKPAESAQKPTAPGGEAGGPSSTPEGGAAS